ncbi:hypothetical protein HBB16_13080 [Pseudonocardia sp. MCCB 268]|nr:hypothetical protein [Pseudonocardia cytotoxica]
MSSHQLAEMELTAQQLVVDRGRCRFGNVSKLRRSLALARYWSVRGPGSAGRVLAGAGILRVDKGSTTQLAVAGTDAVRVGDLALAAGVAVYAG